MWPCEDQLEMSDCERRISGGREEPLSSRMLDRKSMLALRLPGEEEDIWQKAVKRWLYG